MEKMIESENLEANQAIFQNKITYMITRLLTLALNHFRANLATV